MTDLAHALFPTDAPTAAASPMQVTATPAPAVPPQPALAQPSQPSPAPDAAQLFPTETAPDPAASVAAVLEPFASSAWFDGDRDRAEELRGASETLAEDFRQAGTGPDDIREIMDLTREFQANLFAGPLPDDMIRDQTARGYEALAEAGVTDGDLALARRLIDAMETKTPGLKLYLDQTGMGSDVRTIHAVIREAKRRYRNG